MKLLAEITEKSLEIEPTGNILERTYLFRKSARVVLLNDKDEVSLQFTRKYNYYKLPGGGVTEGETEEEAAKREVLEEVGCGILIQQELGLTIEYRNKLNLLHISYGYLARVEGEVGNASYEQAEIEDGYEPIWMPFGESIALAEKHRPLENYEGKFIVERELCFLKEAARILGR